MAHNARVTTAWLRKQFFSSGIQAEAAALNRLAHVLEEAEDPEALLHALLDDIETSMCKSLLHFDCQAFFSHPFTHFCPFLRR